MNISEVFIRRPVATILLVIGGLIGGIAAYYQLPVDALPEADFPTINVSAQLAGASPDTMASSVATPLIKQFETIAGIDSISATSSLGNTSITLQFDLSRNIDAAAADVQAAITRAQRQLPDNLTTPPSYRKVNPADAPIMFLALTGNGVKLTQMDDIAQNIISPALSTVSGVAQAQVYGSKTYAVRIEVNPDKLASRNLSLAGLSKTVAAANSQTPLGTLQNSSQALTVDARTQRSNADEFKTLIVAGSGNRIVRLSDVSTVLDSIENSNQGSWLDGKQTIALGVQRQPGANTVAVVDAIRAKLPEIEAALPATMHIAVVNDRSNSIRAAVTDVQETLAITIGLVILVIFLFLGQVRATLIPGLAVPLSLVATFAAMYACGFSIDNISLLGLTLAVGLVVDDAIVMLENIVRHTEEGVPPFQAAIMGSGEVTSTIISMSLSLVAVFMPILLMGGIVGRVLNEFGMVVTLAILASVLVSLTVTPMLAARLPHVEAKPGRFARMFDRVTESYGRAVGWCLEHRGIILGVFVLSFLGSAWSYATLPRSFFPQEDIGLLSISTQARQDISYVAMRSLQQKAAAIVSANKAVEHVTASLGSGPSGSTFNTGSMFVQLKALGDRPPLEQTLAELRKALARLPGLTAYITPVQSLRFGGRSTQSQYQIVLQSLDAGEARAWSVKLANAMKAEPQTFVDVASDLQDDALQASIKVDNDKAGSLGITADSIRTTLETAFGTYIASQIQTTGNNYDVIVELDQSLPWDETMLGSLRVPTSSGALVPLSSFATVTRTNGPVTVNQSGQLASVTLSFNLPAGCAFAGRCPRVTDLCRRQSPPLVADGGHAVACFNPL